MSIKALLRLIRRKLRIYKMGLAKIIGLFRLTRDAELKYTQDGKPILNMGLACSEKFGEKETQLFVDATAFGKPAEILNQYAGEKGTQIFLTGKLQTDTWEKEGVKQYKMKMIIESFDFVSKPKDGEQKPYTPPQAEYTKHTDYKPEPRQEMPKNTLPEIDINEDEIPF
jgi:single-strand DNA-binding protein